MKYYINGRFLTQKITGVQRYAREITIALDRILMNTNLTDEYILLMPKGILEKLDLKKISIRCCGCLSGHLWEQIELPYYSRSGYLLNFCNCAPLIKCNQTVTIHDAAVAAIPTAYSWTFRVWYKIMYNILGGRLRHILTVSEFSAGELNRYFKISREKMLITYNGIEHLSNIIPNKEIIDKLHLKNKQYILGVSSKNPAKNFHLILEAAKRLPNLHFIIAGGMYNQIFAEEEYSELANVEYVGYVSDEELISLYKNAVAFVYPSLYEGFGIPPLEAMSNKCPVVVSDRASLPEICNNAALYCDAFDVVTLLDAIKSIVQNKNLRMDLIDKGQKRIGYYSWEREARKIYDLLIEVKKN